FSRSQRLAIMKQRRSTSCRISARLTTAGLGGWAGPGDSLARARDEQEVLIMRKPIVAMATAALTCVVAAPASASDNQVSGVQLPGATSTCEDASASFTMTGGLVGCWYEDTATFTKEKVQAGKALIHFSGTEHFSGCLDVDGDGQCAAGD